MKSQARVFSGFARASFAEKDGTIVNFEGREQKFERAVFPPGQCKALSEILMMWANRKDLHLELLDLWILLIGLSLEQKLHFWLIVLLQVVPIMVWVSAEDLH